MPMLAGTRKWQIETCDMSGAGGMGAHGLTGDRIKVAEEKWPDAQARMYRWNTINIITLKLYMFCTDHDFFLFVDDFWKFTHCYNPWQRRDLRVLVVGCICINRIHQQRWLRRLRKILNTMSIPIAPRMVNSALRCEKLTDAKCT